MQSVIADPSLAPLGHQKIDWVAQHSPVLNRLFDEVLNDGSLKGRRIAVVVHLEAKTAYLALLLKKAGAHVIAASSNPFSTQDAVCAALVERGVQVFARHGVSREEFERDLQRVLEARPEFVIDDGAELVSRAVRRGGEVLAGIRGSSEETTTGVMKLEAMAAEGKLPFPALAANHAACKHLFDNRYGTGHSTIGAIMAATNLFLTGKQVVVLGYGWVGRGVARYAAGLGARVTVTEVDPVRALEAYADGFAVANSLDAAATGEVFITTTGSVHVLRREHFARMPDGALIANAGHYAHEIDLDGLAAMAVARRQVRPHVEEFELADGRRIHVIARGELVNIAALDGHPVEIMDLTFAVQALACHYLVNHHHELPPGVHRVPAAIDRKIAETKLKTLGVTLDVPTAEQEAYTRQW
nr:MAG: adenosylhomocysteinase [Bacillota bacterium]